MIVNERLQPGTMVKVDLGETILLGEIVYCAQQASEYAVGLELEDALYDKAAITSLFDAWVKR